MIFTPCLPHPIFCNVITMLYNLFFFYLLYEVGMGLCYTSNPCQCSCNRLITDHDTMNIYRYAYFKQFFCRFKATLSERPILFVGNFHPHNNKVQIRLPISTISTSQTCTRVYICNVLTRYQTNLV